MSTIAVLEASDTNLMPQPIMTVTMVWSYLYAQDRAESLTKRLENVIGGPLSVVKVAAGKGEVTTAIQLAATTDPTARDLRWLLLNNSPLRRVIRDFAVTRIQLAGFEAAGPSRSNIDFQTVHYRLGCPKAVEHHLAPACQP